MEIRDRVREFVTSNFYVETGALEDETSLLDQGIVDSTGVLELVAFLQREFEIEVKDEELLPENLDTVARIAAFVGRKTVVRAVTR